MLNSEESTRERVIGYIQSLAIALGIAVFLFLFVVVPNEVEGQSMEPNFYPGERLYTNRLPHWFNATTVGNILNLNYKRGDVIVIEKPGVEALIKRIVGLPGEKIELKTKHFYINDSLLDESYLTSDVETQGGSFLVPDVAQTIPDDSYFVAGDNRSVSNDSRFFGFVKTDWILGKPFVRIWPLDRFAILN